MSSVHEEIKKVLDEWDPVGVRDFSPDEYLPLADEMPTPLRRAIS